MSAPSHLTRAQAARVLKLNYYNIAPLLRIAQRKGLLNTELHFGVTMILATDIPALKKLAKEVMRAPRQ